MGSGPIAHEGDTLTPPVKCLGYSMIHSSSAIPLVNFGHKIRHIHMETTNVPATTTASATPAIAIPVFAVISATPSSRGGFVVKVRNTQTAREVETGWGTAYSNKQETYYMKLKTAPAVGMEAPLDLNLFDIKERDFIPETGENAGEVIVCKWLSPKA